MGAGLDLADALLADPHLLADLFQREFGTSPDPVPTGKDPPLSLVESIKTLRDRRPPLVLGRFALVFVAPGVGRC